MKKVLIAVDGTRGSKAVLTAFYNMVRPPEEVVLLHVERPGGKSLMYEMLGEAEMSTLREALEGTGHKEAMDRKAEKVLAFYRRELEEAGVGVKTVMRFGQPAEEILKAARQEGAGLIIMGSSGSRGWGRLIAGSVADDVRRTAGIPVLVAKKTTMCEEPYSWKDAYLAVSVSTAVILGLFLLGLVLKNGEHLP